MLVRLSGAENLELDLERSLQLLVLLLGNGLEGDVRMVADTSEGVEALRALVLKVGSCTRIEPPGEPSLYQLGDECYRQHPGARVFLSPRLLREDDAPRR